MPAALAASTTFARAVSSSLLSVGWATAFSCTVESTITRASSFFAMSLRVMATSMVRASNSSTPSSPKALRKRPSWVGSHGHWCSKYSLPEKYCQVGVSPQRWITSSSLSLNACLRYSSATSNRVGSRGRPALEMPPPATALTGPNKSRPSIFLPALTCRAQRWAKEASISCHGIRLARTASGWRKSIIWSRRLRKKSSVMALLSKTPRKHPPLNMSLGVLTIGIHPRSPAFMRASEVLQGGLVTHHGILLDLDPQGVEEDHRVHRLQGTRLPGGDLGHHGLGHAADELGRDLGAIGFEQKALDLAHRHAARVQGDDVLVETREAPLVFGNQQRLEAAVTVTRHLDAQRASACEHRLGALAVALVGPRLGLGRPRGIAQVVAQLSAHGAPNQGLFEGPGSRIDGLGAHGAR